MTAEERLRRIHAILVDEAIEVKDRNGAVIGYAAQLDSKTWRTLWDLSNIREEK